MSEWWGEDNRLTNGKVSYGVPHPDELNLAYLLNDMEQQLAEANTALAELLSFGSVENAGIQFYAIGQHDHDAWISKEQAPQLYAALERIEALQQGVAQNAQGGA